MSSCKAACISAIYILDFTSGVANAGSNEDHAIEVQASGITKSALLPANDYMKNKGDLPFVG